MDRDSKITQVVIVLLIFSDGISNFLKVTNNKSMVVGVSLNSFFYLPSISLTICLMLSVIMFFISKKAMYYKLLSWCILLYGIYSVLFTLFTLLPGFRNYWYIMLMGIIIGIIEFIVGKKMLRNNVLV